MATDEWRLPIGCWRVRFRSETATQNLVMLRILRRGATTASMRRADSLHRSQ